MDEELIAFEEHGSVIVAALVNTRRLDQSNTETFGAALMDYLESHSGTHLLVSLEGIGYISSSVLSELIQAMRKAIATGGSLRVCAVTEYVESVFEVSQLAKTFGLGGALDEAVARFNADLETANA